jgi:hypothetical protein
VTPAVCDTATKATSSACDNNFECTNGMCTGGVPGTCN